jgi:hypothetical protein
VEKETAIWKQYGVSRKPAFMVPPSGHLDAIIIRNLHCPSFSIADPYNELTVDKTNIYIKQVLDIGFSPDQHIFYDYLSRHKALNGLQFYPIEILRIHESFTTELRKHISAIIDIYRGTCVRERTIKICNLTPLKL